MMIENSFVDSNVLLVSRPLVLKKDSVHGPDQNLSDASEQNIAKVIPMTAEQEIEILNNEVQRQKQEYGESSLEQVLDALNSLFQDETFGKELADPHKTVKDSRTAPFLYQGNEYSLKLQLNRPNPLNKLIRKFCNVSIAIEALNPQDLDLPRLGGFNQNEIAATTFSISSFKDIIKIHDASTERRSRKAEDVDNIIFKGSGRALMMIHDIVCRHLLLKHFPDLDQIKAIESEVRDASTDVDARSLAATNLTARTSAVFRQMGYQEDVNAILVKKFG